MAVTDTAAVIDVFELTKVFRDFWGRSRVKAVDALTFSIEPGEVFGLVGPNGSGKTTTIRILLGLLFPTRGQVRVLGVSPRSVAVKKRIGYMPEESHFYPYLNAEETLDFYGRLFRLNRSERRRRVDHLVEMVGLAGARHRPLREYSKGMARRIGIAQALINDPDLVLLDEPTTGLDPIGSRQVKDLIRQLRDRGKTVLLCSHLLADVEDICDRIAILYGGRLRSIGPVRELLAEENQTQIVADGLRPETVAMLLETIRAQEGEKRVDVGVPTRRLESYFLDVVEQARKEMVPTSGALASRMDLGFLDQEATGEELVRDLVKAAEKPAPGPEPVAAEPEPERKVDEEVIKGMVTAPEASRTKPSRSEPKPIMPVRKDVIEDLLERKKPDEVSDEDEPTQKSDTQGD